MHYALYDEDSNRYEVGKKVLTRNAANQHEELEEKLAIRKNGYIETFVVNETGQDVWFDNFKILSQGSILVQETHYDPWGLELTGIGYEYAGVKKNKYLYNGKELIEDNGLQYYDYRARMYDPAIGRWGVVDLLASHELQIDKSPYAYGWNNPIRYIDPNGLCPNGCSETEKSGEPYQDGAIVENKYGTSQYKDGEWKMISMTPDGSGENTSSETSSEGSGSGSTREGNGAFGTFGFGDMLENIDVGVGAFGISNTAKTEIIDYAVRNSFKSAKSRKGFDALSDRQQNWRANRVLGKFGAKYLNTFKVLGRATGYTSAAISVYDFVDHPTLGSFTKASVNVSLAFLRTNPVIGVSMGVLDLTGASDLMYDSIDNLYK